MRLQPKTMQLYAATIALTLAPAAVADIILTFDDLGLPDGTIITDQYADLGITFSVPGGSALLMTARFPIFPGEPQGLQHGEVEDVAIITDRETGFGPLVGAWIDFGSVGDGVMIEAFDGPGGTGNLLGSDSTLTESFISVSAPNIQSVVFSQVGGGATYLIDNFTFQLIPAPSGLALLGMAGLLGTGRRRRQ